jgi:carbamoylphosphate synthase small subunit
MQNIKTVFVVPPDDYSVEACFERHGYIVSRDIYKADALVFTGGADVNPALYGEKCLPRTHYDPKRDAWEIRAFEIGKTREVPLIGICRGGQLLNVLAGGSLWQHVDNHNCRKHKIDVFSATSNGKKVGSYTVTSDHHQIMRPTSEGIVLGSTQLSSQKICDKEYLDQKDIDVEIVYYPRLKAYCFQPHPEWDVEGETSDVFFGHLNEFFG